LQPSTSSNGGTARPTHACRRINITAAERNIAARLDRLPILPFHRRLLFLIGAGNFFDSFDIYLAGSVLGALLHDNWSDLASNARFISATFVGMVIGAAVAGWLGDKFGRRFTYQFNLAIFGAASVAKY